MQEQNDDSLNNGIQEPQQIESACASPFIQPIETYKADLKDGVFAIVVFLLGYLFSRWVLVSWQGWGVAGFTVLYLLSASLYFYKKGVHFSRPSWFWLMITGLTGLSYAFWNGYGIGPLKAMFLFCAAIFWAISVTNTKIAGKTGNFLVLDGINAVFIIPFRNFIEQYKSLSVFKKDKANHGIRYLPIMIGIALALLLIFLVSPLLLRADSGGFSKIIDVFSGFFTFETEKITIFLVYCIPAIPISAYLFGLIFGSANKKGTNAFSLAGTNKTVASLRFLQPVTVFTVLGTVCGLYIIFIASQLPYFFSAFTGNRPSGWLVYAEYARSGFFELCQIAAINLALITGANILSKKQRQDSRTLKIFNIVLALLTILLIATAFSKMALYIDAYGLSMLRLLPCLFMVFLAFICLAVIALQKWQFSIVRLSLVVGTLMFCMFTLADPDGFVVRYNTDRYLRGTLSDYDMEILYRAGPAGVLPAIEVYQQLPDGSLKDEIQLYLEGQKGTVLMTEGTHSDTLQNRLAFDRLHRLELEHIQNKD